MPEPLSILGGFIGFFIGYFGMEFLYRLCGKRPWRSRKLGR